MKDNPVLFILGLVTFIAVISMVTSQPDSCSMTGCSRASLYTLPLFMTVTLVAVIFYRKKGS